MTHKPATPLRLAIAGGYLVTTKNAEGVGLDARILAKVEPHAEAALQAWCDEANAYPRLVEALRALLNHKELKRQDEYLSRGIGTETGFGKAILNARALLAELGE